MFLLQEDMLFLLKLDMLGERGRHRTITLPFSLVERPTQKKGERVVAYLYVIRLSLFFLYCHKNGFTKQ
jgi:hypothetical protein